MTAETTSNTEEAPTRNDVYQIVTDKVIELLEAGVVPWHKPWAGGEQQFPMNLVSKKLYRGINVWLLSAAGYSAPYWVSFKQAQQLGGNVRKGEKSSLAVFWKRLETIDKASGEKKFIPLLRYYRVFNVEQCDGINYPKPEPRSADFNPIAAAESIVEGMPKRPAVTHVGGRAFYSPASDTVNVPAKNMFDGEQEFYSTLFHELTHATGHATRLDRALSHDNSFGDTNYAKEELVAELGASYLSATAGILHRTLNNSAAYIQNWLTALRNDRKLIVNAAAAAQRATDFILSKTFGEEASRASEEGAAS